MNCSSTVSRGLGLMYRHQPNMVPAASCRQSTWTHPGVNSTSCCQWCNSLPGTRKVPWYELSNDWKPKHSEYICWPCVSLHVYWTSPLRMVPSISIWTDCTGYTPTQWRVFTMGWNGMVPQHECPRTSGSQWWGTPVAYLVLTISGVWIPLRLRM